MNVFVTIIVTILIYLFGGLLGYEIGKTEMCRTLNAEYHNGTCMKVERKQVIISNENNKETKL